MDPTSATDRAGRDVSAAIARTDGITFSTDRRTITQATVEDFQDHITLEFPAPAGTDSAALVLTMRNSLLNTVLFYDVMLGASGAHALDWLGKDLLAISNATSLARWYANRMGARIELWTDAGWQPVGRVPDSGPIAWKETAVMLPVAPGSSTMQVRLTFVADQWRFDRIALATSAHRVEVRTIPVTRAFDRDDMPVDSLRDALSDADARYLRTMPGERMTLHFDTGPAPESRGTRTYMIASQGYYTEWVRPEWVRSASRSSAFTPTDTAFLHALRRWDAGRDSLERRFYTTRIPVR
jgi:hypothetical protein